MSRAQIFVACTGTLRFVSVVKRKGISSRLNSKQADSEKVAATVLSACSRMRCRRRRKTPTPCKKCWSGCRQRKEKRQTFQIRLLADHVLDLSMHICISYYKYPHLGVHVQAYLDLYSIHIQILKCLSAGQRERNQAVRAAAGPRW